MRPIVLRSHGRLSSLGWLTLGVLFSFPFLAVGLTPGGKIANLLVGIPVFAFFVGLAFWDLGRSDGLVFDLPRKRGFLVRGRYLRRERIDFDPREVARVVLVASWVGGGGGGDQHTHAASVWFYDLRLELRDGHSLTLPLGTRRDAEELAVLAGRALGLRVDRETRGAAGP